MKTFFSTPRPAAFRPIVPPNGNRLNLVRSFVETGDERCPIAGIWSRIVETDATPDDPEIPWPAMRRLLPWRAASSLRYFASLS